MSIEEELCELVAHGDMDAREKLFHANYGLIGTIIKEHKVNAGITYNDLYSEGAIGLWRGIEMYKLGKGTKLASYCQYWIHYRVKKALELKTRVIRVPRYLVQLGIKHIKTKEEFESDIARDLTEEEEAVFNNANKRGKMAADACINCVSIHNVMSSEDGGDFTLEDTVADAKTLEDTVADATTIPGENLEMEELLGKLPALLKTLSVRNRRIIRQRFGIGCKKKTLEMLAKTEGVTKEWIRQLEKESILMMREEIIKMI